LTSLLDINEMPIVINENEDNNVSEQNCNCQKNSDITSCGKYRNHNFTDLNKYLFIYLNILLSIISFYK